MSWGIGCGESGVPAVYADVASASCWIDRQVSQSQRMNLNISLCVFRSHNFMVNLVPILDLIPQIAIDGILIIDTCIVNIP